MADLKLFGREDGTPAAGDKLAYGTSSTQAKNISVSNFRTLMFSDVTVHTKTFEIGEWNMDSASSSPLIRIFSGSTSIFPSRIPIAKIRGVRAIIRNDAGTVFADFMSVQNGTSVIVPQIQIIESTFIWTSTNVLLTRRTGSFFDSADYSKTTNPDTTPYNRGWIIVDYVL